jgi:hypothetical protein
MQIFQQNAHEPKNQDSTHVRKMKVISLGSTFMGNVSNEVDKTIIDKLYLTVVSRKAFI